MLEHPSLSITLLSSHCYDCVRIPLPHFSNVQIPWIKVDPVEHIQEPLFKVKFKLESQFKHF